MKSPIVIKLNGVVINGKIDGTEEFTITWRENDDDGGLAKSYSTELTFYDDGYSILKTILIDNPNGFVNKVDVQIFDECCGRLVFQGYIAGDAIDWCEPECWISANIVESNEALSCVKSTLITDNHDGFLYQNQKKMRYCVEPRPDFLYTILFFIYGIINLIITVVTLGTNLIFGYLDNFRSRMIQCNWYHPSALARDYIQNVCRKCGLEFESSILNSPSSPYYDLILFSAMTRKGYKPSDTNSTLISENAPIETLDTLFTRHLNQIFNARYWILDGKLIFERKDYFSNGNIWIDAEQLLNDGRIIENRICFSWNDKPKYAYAVYKYIEDGMDMCSNEISGRYDDIVEWNSPPSPLQKDALELTLSSSRTRFRNDGASTDVLKAAVQQSFTFGITSGGFVDSTNGNIIMSNHTASNYKFIIWDSASGDDYAKARTNYDLSFTSAPIRRPFTTPGSEILSAFDPNSPTTVPPINLYNYPMTFNNYANNNLYWDFHYIDNPRLGATRLYDFSFTFEFDCGEFNAIDFTKNVRIKVGNQIKFGEVKELVVDFVKRTILVKGIV